eukprot:scaffold10220_cov144-Isochrysis_galbana.AAC.5
MSTPVKPPGSQACCMWYVMTAATATARSPSTSARNAAGRTEDSLCSPIFCSLLSSSNVKLSGRTPGDTTGSHDDGMPAYNRARGAMSSS